MSISISVAAKGADLRVDEVLDAVGDCSGLDQTLGRCHNLVGIPGISLPIAGMNNVFFDLIVRQNAQVLEN